VIDVETYRIGWWTHRWWPHPWALRSAITGRTPKLGKKASRIWYLRVTWRQLRSLRRPHRPWQAEAEGVRFCRRAFTAEGARRKMLRDVEVAYGVVTGYHLASPWQLRHEAKANAREIRAARSSGPIEAEIVDA